MAEPKTELKKKAHLIFVPSPGAGHIFSCLEFAQLLITKSNDLFITVLTSNFPSSSSPAPSHTESNHPQIQLIPLPQVDPPSQELSQKARELYVLTFIESLIPHVKAKLQNIILSSSYPNSESTPVFGLVLDLFCVCMIDVGNELGIPSYLYMTSNSGFLGYMFYLQERESDEIFDEFDDSDLMIQGISTLVPTRVLPVASFNRDGGYYAYHMLAKRYRETKGIVVNTFSELEHYAIDSLSHDKRNPAIYSVGPLVDLKGQPNENLDQTQHDKIMKWLDEQPHCSVIFLCFGSRGAFGSSQTRELALGLRRSGVKFLWARQSPRDIGIEEEEDDGKLPEGFIEWMEEGNGMMCKWAPQVEILAHKAIGGFVSHCGWNSILESLWFGVPILTWPVYAEQQLNAFRMVKELGLSVELRLSYKGGSDLVMADEIEKGVKQLMDRDNVVHKKVQEVKEMARNAVLDGGSSSISVGKFIDDVIGSN